MKKNWFTEEQAKAIDIRDYRHLVNEYYGRWNSPGIAERKARATVFNKRSIVFDKSFRFTLKVEDLKRYGEFKHLSRFSVWPYYSIDGSEASLISEELETEFAETAEELERLVVSILYYINTRI